MCSLGPMLAALAAALLCLHHVAAAAVCSEYVLNATNRLGHTAALQCEPRALLPAVHQCCCGRDLAAGPVTCLPAVIVAGAQKGGTTALFGHLLLHPLFRPPSRKELHAFDVGATRWRVDPVSALATYLSYFPHHVNGTVRVCPRARGKPHSHTRTHARRCPARRRPPTSSA